MPRVLGIVPADVARPAELAQAQRPQAGGRFDAALLAHGADLDQLGTVGVFGGWLVGGHEGSSPHAVPAVYLASPACATERRGIAYPTGYAHRSRSNPSPSAGIV